MDTSIEPLVVSSLSFGSRRRTPLSLLATPTITASAPAMAPPARLRGDCGGSAGGGGGGGGGSGGGRRGGGERGRGRWLVGRQPGRVEIDAHLSLNCHRGW